MVKPLKLASGKIQNLQSGDSLTDGDGNAFGTVGGIFYSITPNPVSVEGTTETLIGSMRIRSGTATVYAHMGTVSGSNTATIKLYKQSDSSLITTLNKAGALGTASVGSVSIASTDWYEVRGFCSSAADTSVFRGVVVQVT